ncbi:MerR family transcriptional regulator [Microlunatus aurantiacus]|uniref:transcriptional regulator FtsR n=1 Tax=Microlunatus aurantiacus TaxID=446786 RepID=UPI0031DE9510
MPRNQVRSIGQVLAALKGDFPDVSISKIRFLETEGLVTPERAPSGYRRYVESDIERLRYVLTVQRDHYLPLKVIREHLSLIDRGEAPPGRAGLLPAGATPVDPGASTASASTETSTGDAGATTPAPSSPTPPSRQPLRLSRKDLLEASGLSESALMELERNNIVTPRRGTAYYGRDALTLATAAKRLSDYGMDGRHLRAFKMAADREIGMVEQAIAPYLRRSEGRGDVVAEVLSLVINFHAALVRSGLEK